MLLATAANCKSQDKPFFKLWRHQGSVLVSRLQHTSQYFQPQPLAHNYTNMKSLLTIALVACCAVAATAQDMDSTMVQFSVDMNGVESFDASLDTIRVAGDFQGWSPKTADNANVLTDPDSNGVYTVMLPALAETSILFKYVINNWSGSEDRADNEFVDTETMYGDCVVSDDSGNSNRSEAIPSADTVFTLPVYVYNTCEVSALMVSSQRDFVQLEGVRIMPNPMTERATLMLPSLPGEQYVVRVLGSDGRVAVAPQTTSSTTIELDRANLPSGLYLVDVMATQAGQRAVLRVLVD